MARPSCVRIDAAAFDHEQAAGGCGAGAAAVGVAAGALSFDVCARVPSENALPALADDAHARGYARRPGLRDLRSDLHGIAASEPSGLLPGALLLLLVFPRRTRAASSTSEIFHFVLPDDFRRACAGRRVRGFGGAECISLHLR